MGMISVHKQNISQMEKQAQSGEHEQSPMQAGSPTQVPVQRRRSPSNACDYEEVSEEESVEESEEESEEEGVFNKVNNFLGRVRDDLMDEFVHDERPQQPRYPQYYTNGHTPNGHGPSEHLSNGQLQRKPVLDGASGSPTMRNGFGSPMGHPSDQNLVPSHSSMPPLVPFATGNLEAQSPSRNGRAPSARGSSAAVGLSPDRGQSSGLVNSPISQQPGPMRPNWPPANVYHGSY